ncbi:phage/plasmid primase, P4 family [Nonomuraea sp. NPDC050663]|uniref:phage/plasmid primase, P4 family n=1 Tax=Nonomuraea sp. NPDC050663 TaxID=3364370 RepID=UPI00378933D3
MTNLHNAVVGAHQAGLCVIPVKNDGSKAPVFNWKTFQAERPSLDVVNAWFSDDRYDGFGVICGAVSGNVEMLELEGRAVTEGVFNAYFDLLHDHNLSDLWERVTSGYCEMTPSGGLHILMRVDGEPRGNTKLARRPSTTEELTVWKAQQQADVDAETDEEVRARRQTTLDKVTRGEQVPQVLIETRGEGGFVVVAPSGGRSHPTGRAWTMVRGGFASIATVTEDERDALHAIATLLDTMPAAEPPSPQRVGQSPTHDTDAGVRPGDDFNAHADWADILQPHGWKHARTFGRARGWTRPGKGIGLSATTGRNDGDNLYVFSSSTIFDTEKPYSKFAAYTLLEHGGNYANAARALRLRGYGSERPRDDFSGLLSNPPKRGSDEDDEEDDRDDDFAFLLGEDGNLATVHPIRPKAEPAPDGVAETTYRYSEDRNALALIERFGNTIRYCPDRSRWLAWDGRRWQWCESGGGIVAEYAKKIARALPEHENVDRKYKAASLSARGINASLTLARSDPRVMVPYSALDANPWELNTPGGIIDLRTGQLLPSDPAKLHTRMTTATPDFDADLGRWGAFLADTFGGDQELVEYMQRLVGYSAVGEVGPHILPFCFGSGGNGKGVFLEACAHVLGDYSGKAPRGFLTVKTSDPHPQEIAKLAGARFVLCSETNEGDKFDESKVKELTGGDSLTGHFMRENDFTFTPSHTLWLMGNNKPSVRSGGRSFWRRLRLIGFEHEVPEGQAVDDLQGILAREHGAVVMAWIARGAAAYAAHGLAEPKSVTEATAEYQKEQETVDRFVDERCHIGGGNQVTVKVAALYAAYEKWCAAERCDPVTKTSFTLKLKKFGVEAAKGGKGVRIYINIALLSDEDDDSRESWFR